MHLRDVERNDGPNVILDQLLPSIANNLTPRRLVVQPYTLCNVVPTPQSAHRPWLGQVHGGRVLLATTPYRLSAVGGKNNE
jgi:hypothetical protein